MFCASPQEACENILAGAGRFFPDAVEYQFLAVPDTGYDLTLRLSARETMDEFLGKYFRDGSGDA